MESHLILPFTSLACLYILFQGERFVINDILAHVNRIPFMTRGLPRNQMQLLVLVVMNLLYARALESLSLH